MVSKRCSGIKSHTHWPANQYLLRFVFLLPRGGGGVPAVQSAMQLATQASTVTRTAASQQRSYTHCGAANAGVAKLTIRTAATNISS